MATTTSDLTARSDLPRITEGDDVDYVMSFADSNGDPIDITGWTVSVTVAERDRESTALIQKDVTTHDDAANGETSFTFTASDTSGLTGHKRYDIQVKRDDGTVKTIVFQSRAGFSDRLDERDQVSSLGEHRVSIPCWVF